MAEVVKSRRHEVFSNIASQNLTPTLEKVPNYLSTGQRQVTRSSDVIAPPSSLARPNYEDILRRVSVVIFNHIENCERRFKEARPEQFETGLYHLSQLKVFSEENFESQRYMYNFVRMPISRVGFCYGINRQRKIYKVPTLNEVHTFLETLFVKAQLSPECSIVSLIYVERLMEQANVPLVAQTWAPILLCGLLIASKVWADMSSWNIEIAQIYPQYSLQSINRLERTFCHNIGWDLYISSSLYAKYYFALRAATEKKDFRRNYNVMMVQAPGAEKIAERSGDMKNAMKDIMSMSM